MHARLIITARMRTTRLELGNVSLDEPRPKDQSLSENYYAFSYYGRIGVRSAALDSDITPVTFITTVPGTGWGQTKLFDDLVGKKVAVQRLAMDREMREKLAKDRSYREELAREIELDEDDINHIREGIRKCAYDQSHTFFAHNKLGLARYTSANREFRWGVRG